MKRWQFSFACVFIALNILDLTTTFYILNHGGAESNPVAVLFYRWHLAYLMKFIIVGGIVWLSAKNAINKYLYLTFIIYFGCVVLWNIHIIHILRSHHG